MFLILYVPHYLLVDLIWEYTPMCVSRVPTTEGKQGNQGDWKNKFQTVKMEFEKSSNIQEKHREFESLRN